MAAIKLLMKKPQQMKQPSVMLRRMLQLNEPPAQRRSGRRAVHVVRLLLSRVHLQTTKLHLKAQRVTAPLNHERSGVVAAAALGRGRRGSVVQIRLTRSEKMIFSWIRILRNSVWKKATARKTRMRMSGQQLELVVLHAEQQGDRRA